MRIEHRERAGICVLLAMMALGLSSCGAVQRPYAHFDEPTLCNLLCNHSVHWSTGSLGVLPSLRGEIPRELWRRGGKAVPALVKALEDSERFEAAHVLLTWMIPRTARERVEFKHFVFEGLGIIVRTGEGIRGDPKYQKKLIQYWQRQTDWKDGAAPAVGSELGVRELPDIYDYEKGLLSYQRRRVLNEPEMVREEPEIDIQE